MRAHWQRALGVGLWLLCSPATADEGTLEQPGLGAAEFARLAADLGSEDQARREAADRALRGLYAESLPGIEQRLRVLARQRPSADDAKAALGAFRRAMGSRRGDDILDIAAGVPKVLATREGRQPDVLSMAEPLLLLRSLERIAERAVGPAMASILLLDAPGVWDFEFALARQRAGLSLLPTLIALRSHEDARVRAFAQAGVHALGMEDPALATSLPDTHLASEVVRAYTQPLDYAAMPTLVRLVNADKLELREAARFAVQRFGKNAIWQVRQLYTEVTSQNPNRSWDAERTARELYAVLDRAQTEEAAMLLKKGMSAQASGDLTTMKDHYDQLLARFPRYAERAKLAPGYAAVGEDFLTHDRLQNARDAFERALRLAPDASAAKLLRAKVAFVDAELAQSRGVVDLHGYDQALRHEPGMQSAVVAKERLTGVRAARERRNKRLAAGAAILLLLSACAMLLRGQSVSAATDPSIT